MPHKVETIVFSNIPAPFGERLEDDKLVENRLNGMEADGWTLKAVVPSPHGVQVYWSREREPAL